jgi:catechol 2,3-dioxygenase-like lactoylglutathione lyase family enzyme
MVPKILFIAEIGLRVSDLPKMKEFYRDVMGFSIEIEEENHVFMKIADLPSPLGALGHGQLFVLFARGVQPDIRVTTLDHLAFEISPDEYDETLNKFKAAGLVLRERSWPDSLDWRGRSFFFYDPEKNVIEIITAAPETG